ncbi:hypothetical protein [Chondrinema litorale]|uniref:hypothetical protein n=1 Tax=Chondrinema litorale TaxID=2994555 RepID=UPI0025431C40|nr:hypothetical protein [Chondrinema litorale]UZR94769.1 hypothetical protein OQ292_02930 [Chondrinema litorale]
METQQRYSFEIDQKKLDKALFDIADGEHNTDTINYTKSFIRQLIKNNQFSKAYEILHQLVEVRQANTTTILWIGSYLKDIFFDEDAIKVSQRFDKTALEEMLFYYLKACKLFDPGYQKIKETVKELEN